MKQSLELFILTCELYVFASKDPYFGKSFAKCLLFELAFGRSYSKKWYLRLYVTQIMHSNGKILFSWRKNCLSKFLWFWCFGTRRQVFIVWRSSLKQWYLRFWHKSSLQMVKCSLFQPKDCLSKFLWRTAHVKLFFLQRKVWVL